LKKVLFVGDNHIDDKQPENRSDNYLEATLRKLKECLTIAEEENKKLQEELGETYEKVMVERHIQQFKKMYKNAEVGRQNEL